MCTTIDGKILGHRWPRLPGIKPGSNLFETTASSFNIPAWIVGTKTMTEFSSPATIKLPRSVPSIAKYDHLANRAAKSFAIAPDNHAALRFKHNEVGGDHVVLLITRKAPDTYLAHLQSAGVSYLFCGESKVNLPAAMTKLRTLFNMKKLMLQGGGLFNAAMLHAGLIDEISQLILPIADGGGSAVSSIFDHEGPAPKKSAASLRLLSQRQLSGGVQWLRYRVTKYHNAG
jgi:riboflavin biosynthesis pyrimidine reductase